jgi:putative membrane protein insertion efficiency factor
MKKAIIVAINIYQRTIAVVLLNLGLKGDCRFSPTCSEYAKNSISQKGILKGSYLSVARVLKCQPFYKGN